MARQKDTFYFEGFRRSADYACQAAKLLSEVMHDFNPGQLRERMDSMHAIEKSADEVRHDMMDELVTAFITPFDREDIDELGHVLDDVTDSIEGVLNRMYYDNVTDMRDDAVQMSDMVVRATESICELVNELPRFRHSKTLRELVFAINTIETDADRYPYGYPQTYLLPTVVNNEITAGVSQSMMVYTPIAQGITTDEDSKFTFTQLLTTGDTAYAMENYATAETAQKADTDPEGSFAVAVAAENAATGARVVWVNCPNLLLSSINQQVSGGNAQLLGSAVNWLNGAQTTAVINAKSMSAASLNVPVSAAVPLGVLFTLVLPIVCLIAGAVICVVRRRR